MYTAVKWLARAWFYVTQRPGIAVRTWWANVRARKLARCRSRMKGGE